MPVGTGSINRAARTSRKAAGAGNNVDAVKDNEVVKDIEEIKNTKTGTIKKSIAKKNTAQKPAAKKAAAPKKETVSAEKKTAPELKVYADETVFVVGNECCQLTQELPIHLL